MRFCGTVYKDGKFWLAEILLLDAMTQGYTRKEALVIVADLIETLVDQPDFSVQVHPGRHGHFEISASDIRPVVSLLLLRRQRERSGLSLAAAAERLGVKSRNAYARYERGESLPTLEKLDELL